MCKSEIVKEIVIIAGFILASYWDVKRKEVPVWIIYIMAFIGIVIGVADGRILTIDMLLSILIGIVCLGISKITNEAIGMGDALWILVVALYINFEFMLGWMLLFLTLAGIVAAVLLVIFKKSRNYEIAMIPIMFGGYCILDLCRLSAI